MDFAWFAVNLPRRAGEKRGDEKINFQRRDAGCWTRISRIDTNCFNAEAWRGQAATKAERGSVSRSTSALRSVSANFTARRASGTAAAHRAALRENLRSSRRSWEIALQRRKGLTARKKIAQGEASRRATPGVNLASRERNGNARRRRLIPWLKGLWFWVCPH